METQDKIQENLLQFTGSVNLHIHERFGIRIHLTEGCNYLREACECYWLFDLILSYQSTRKLMVESFQVWKLTVENGKADLLCSDGNGNYLLSHIINPLLDSRSFNEGCIFPLPEITIWLVDGIAMLPTEY